MRRLVLATTMCAVLGACAAPGAVNTPHADLERAETAAELAFQAARPALSGKQLDKAWADLQEVRRLYNAGQSIDAAVVILKADIAASKGSI